MKEMILGGKARHIGGWKAEPLELRDHRDLFFAPKPRPLPEEYDLDDFKVVPVFDQLDVGDCVENAVCQLAAFAVWKHTGALVTFARLFGYAVARQYTGTELTDDSGLYVPTAFKSLRRDGLCYESTWPYGKGSDRFMLDPTPAARTEAKLHQGLFYYRCASLHAIKESILQGWPLAFGTQVASDLSDDGEFRMPGKGASFDEGHSMVYKGWSDKKVLRDGSVGALKTRNSWGGEYHAEDCLPGECWVSYELVARGYATDAMTLRGIEIPGVA